MKMANVTLSIPDDLLSKARKYAALKGKSLNALIREFLENLTKREEQLKEATQKFLKLSEMHEGELEKWEREKLYEL